MNSFMEWLADEAKGFKAVLGYVVFAALVVISLDYAVDSALINLGLAPSPPLPAVGDTPFRYYNAMMFATMFLWGPIKEEVIFRVLPLSVVVSFISRKPAYVFGAMAACAGIFGAIHPYGLAGKTQVAIAGFFFGLVFLKCGGMSKSFVKASACAMAAHGLSNLFTVIDAWWDYFALVK